MKIRVGVSLTKDVEVEGMNDRNEYIVTGAQLKALVKDAQEARQKEIDRQVYELGKDKVTEKEISTCTYCGHNVNQGQHGIIEFVKFEPISSMYVAGAFKQIICRPFGLRASVPTGSETSPFTGVETRTAVATRGNSEVFARTGHSGWFGFCRAGSSVHEKNPHIIGWRSEYDQVTRQLTIFYTLEDGTKGEIRLND